MRANKLQIRNAVEQMYNVVVTDVNTVNYMGKLKSRYTKAGFLSGRANNFKKAIVTLKDGDKIDFTVISNEDGSKKIQTCNRRYAT